MRKMRKIMQTIALVVVFAVIVTLAFAALDAFVSYPVNFEIEKGECVCDVDDVRECLILTSGDFIPYQPGLFGIIASEGGEVIHPFGTLLQGDNGKKVLISSVLLPYTLAWTIEGDVDEFITRVSPKIRKQIRWERFVWNMSLGEIRWIWEEEDLRIKLKRVGEGYATLLVESYGVDGAWEKVKTTRSENELRKLLGLKPTRFPLFFSIEPMWSFSYSIGPFIYY